MSSSGARQRFPGRNKTQEKERSKKERILTEEEAVNKASRKWIGQLGFALLFSLAVPPLLLILLPSPFTPKVYPPLTPPALFEGPLSLNDDLAFAEKIYEDQLFGPESLVIDGDNIYTGTSDGWVNHLYQGKIRKLVQFGQGPCGGLENEKTCGRPLGMRMDKDGQLIVVDAYFGLFRVNITSGEYETLYKASIPINGKLPMLLNHVDIDDQGRIYFSDSSTEWHRNQFLNILFEGDATGRLLMYDPKTKQTTQLIGDLMFPNGVQVTHDQGGVLVAELARARILRYDFQLKKISVWVDGLPGFPDNIRYDRTSKTYWVALAVPRYSDKFSPLEFSLSRPWLRGIVAKVITVSNLPTLTRLIKYFGVVEPQVVVVEIDAAGSYISSLQERKGKVLEAVSEIQIHDGKFYIGSYHSGYLACLDLKKRTNK